MRTGVPFSPASDLTTSGTPQPPSRTDRGNAQAAVSLPLLLVLATVVACVWFLTLGARHLIPSDEGRYAEIAREMLVSGDWVTIRYNGVKYFEKPPFQMWMTAAAFEVFGIGEWQARLWTAFSGAAGLVVTAFAAWRWYGARVGILTALALLAMPAWNLGSHVSALDMALSGALAFVLAGVLIAQHPDATVRTRRRWMLVAWAAMGIAVLTKGPIGIVLPGLTLVVYTAITRDLGLWRRIHLGLGLVVMLAIAAPWFVLVSQRNPEFARFFFVHEHLDRFLSPVHHREGPWWYFLPQVVVGFLPWLGLSWAMLRSLREPSARDGLRPSLLLPAWAGTVLVFFSASSSKLPGYILPMYPALAIMAARVLERLDAAARRRQLIFAFFVMVVGAAAVPYLAGLGSDQTPNALYRDFAVWVAAAVATGSIGLVVAWRLDARNPHRALAAYALAFFAFTTVLLRGHESFGLSSSGAELAARVAPLVDDATPIYSVRLLDHTMPFYLRHVTTLVQEPGELEFGVGQEPGKWLPTEADFVRAWTSGGRALALMSHRTYDQLRTRQLPMIVVGEDVRRVVVANRIMPSR